MVNKQAVRILLECILVEIISFVSVSWTNVSVIYTNINLPFPFFFQGHILFCGCPGFSRGGTNPKRGASLLFGHNLPKTAWKWRKLDREGGADISNFTMWIRHCSFQIYIQHRFHAKTTNWTFVSKYDNVFRVKFFMPGGKIDLSFF